MVHQFPLQCHGPAFYLFLLLHCFPTCVSIQMNQLYVPPHFYDSGSAKNSYSTFVLLLPELALGKLARDKLNEKMDQLKKTSSHTRFSFTFLIRCVYITHIMIWASMV